ncbi:zf-TFIIB domain-containing protein [Paenibacillus sp. YN15]|uniref:TFIIB-type zinc ribbon-containing protein n=1 Tax=Paenibacillus sp. YN15 TaxID=1742774 RepID=UPI000DCDC613|nr:zf-TFIIB domain-containing protein [Paenibacillus sp. YN15]RAU96520.1 hypothetical protein DQG13_20225 [Paenibacillus sp. YN15]
MNCPVCDNVRMREVEKAGVTIDTCPQCKGVWLDRGELDKLMGGVREVRDDFNTWQNQRDDEYERRDYERHDDERRDHGHSPSYDKNHYPQQGYKGKKKKSILDSLGDLFD